MADKFLKRIQVVIDEDLEMLIPEFLENRRKDVLNIMHALEKGDFETVRNIGHIIKGVGGGYGFGAITDMGVVLETAAESQDVDKIRVQIDKLSFYLDNIDIVYK